MRITAPVVCLMALTGVFLTGSLVYIMTGAAASPLFATLFLFGASWAAAWWTLEDCRARRVPASIDHGWFVFYAWPFVLPVHLLRTRGASGCAIGAFAVIAFMIVYTVVGVVIAS